MRPILHSVTTRLEPNQPKLRPYNLSGFIPLHTWHTQIRNMRRDMAGTGSRLPLALAEESLVYHVLSFLDVRIIKLLQKFSKGICVFFRNLDPGEDFTKVYWGNYRKLGPRTTFPLTYQHRGFGSGITIYSILGEDLRETCAVHRDARGRLAHGSALAKDHREDYPPNLNILSLGTFGRPPIMYLTWLLAISSSLMSWPCISEFSKVDSSSRTSDSRDVDASLNDRSTCALSPETLYR